MPSTSSLLVAQQPPTRERPLQVLRRLAGGVARPGTLEREVRQDQALAGGVTAEVAVALQPARRQGTGLGAGQLRVGGGLGLEQQRQLPIVGLDDLDRRQDRLDRPVRVSRHGQRVREQANRGREQPGLAYQVDRRREVLHRLGRRQAELGGPELEQHLGRGRREAAAPPAHARARRQQRRALRARARPRPPGAAARPGRGPRLAPPR